jgi:hypothetical protein
MGWVLKTHLIFVKMILEAETPIGNVAPRRFAVLSYVRLAERNLPMKWLVACVITVVALAGCKSSQTPFNTLAPFGSARVPPPSTNHVNAPGNYYNGAAPPQTATPAVPGATPAPAAAQPAAAASGKMSSNTNPTGTNVAWQPSGKTASMAGTTNPSAAASLVTGVQPVSYQADANGTKNAASATPASGSALRLSGMPVNDATASSAAAEPARFVPAGSPIEIAQLPQPPTAPGTTPPTGTVVASAQASDQPAPASASSQSTLQWKSRP